MKFIYLINTSTNKFEKKDYDKSHNIISDIYYLKYRLPSLEEIKKGDNKVKKFYEEYSLNRIKELISRIDNLIPLFNIYHINIYLINKENVYYRVIYDNYRFPDETISKYFIKYLEDTKKVESTNILLIRKKRKIKLMLDFLNQLDMKELYRSYIDVFTKYSPDIGNSITQCYRPSFINVFNHLKPYYTRKELIKLALNMNLKLKGNPYNPDNINEICEQVSKNDINHEILLSHQKHIVRKNKVGLIKYYTIQGSYFLNQYMRKLTSYAHSNNFLEDIIKDIWVLIKEAPEFDNNYYLYRFVDDDSYIKHLKVGDIYEEGGFMSTTRDPFYKSDEYKFGFILLKIKIPKGVRGIGLCLETLSQFPAEQEIILPPRCNLKLVAKNSNCTYHHIDQNYGNKIKIRYEFEWIENKDIKFTRKKIHDQDIKIIDFLNLDDNKTLSLREKAKIFVSKHVNDMGYFKVNIGDQTFQLISEWFNSVGAYKDFYSLETSSGFSIYTIFEGHILFMIELADINEDRRMNVNYYLRYTNIDRNKIIPEKDFVLFLASVANYFDIPRVVIYSDFISCDNVQTERSVLKIQRKFSSDPLNTNIIPIKKDTNQNISYYGGYHSLDIYNYLKHSDIRFNDIKLTKLELTPMYNITELDKLKKNSPLKILVKEDNDELYQIYLRNYYPNFKNKDNISDFYIWIVKNYCYLISTLILKFNRLYKVDNPFENITYILVPDMFLYNRKYIKFVNDDMINNYVLKKTYEDSITNYRTTVDKVKKIALF
jgi:hypothetical protein